MTAQFDVVIPLYNRGELAFRAVQSVFDQVHSLSRVIIIDDGSTDGCVEQLGHWFPSAEIYSQTNAGAGAARNRGISLASAEWVAFLDADDFWTPAHLSSLSELIKCFPECHLVSSAHIEWHKSEVEVPPQNLRQGVPRKIDYFKEASLNPRVVHSSAAACRRTSLLESGGFGTSKTGEDLLCWARVASRHEVALHPLATAVYVRGVGGVMDEQRLSRGSVRPSAASPLTTLLEEPVVTLKSPEVCFVEGLLASGGPLSVPRRSLECYLYRRALDWMLAGIVSNDRELYSANRSVLGRHFSWRRVVLEVLAAIPASWLTLVLRLRSAESVRTLATRGARQRRRPDCDTTVE